VKIFFSEQQQVRAAVEKIRGKVAHILTHFSVYIL
jgi:hypothetical protein